MADKKQIFVDFLFIGLGAANCLLLLNMFKNDLLHNKKIAVIEPDNKHVNDRTFCFWTTHDELTSLNLEDLVSTKWNHLRVNGGERQSIEPLHYYRIKGIDLYDKAKSILKEGSSQFFATAFTGVPVIQEGLFEIHLNDTVLVAKKVFDSRPPSFSLPNKNQSHLYQSFIGWEIESSNHLFDVSAVVMMDFDIPQNNSCQFIYVLPFTEHTALVEITRFGTEKITRAEAELILKEYIDRRVGGGYRIIEEEKGVISMSSANVTSAYYGPDWIDTGARANMVKPSTGYAFHSMALDAMYQADAMKNNRTYIRKKKNTRFDFYDRLLLKILEAQPHAGKQIFQALFDHVPIPDVLTFLREKTAIKKEIFIFSKLPIGVFVKAALKDIFYRILNIQPVVISFLFTIISIILYTLQEENLLWMFLGAGFLAIGLPHGAVDHLTDTNIKNKIQLLKYSINYLLKGAFLGLIWLLLPDLALILFILYSAWHFGQADFIQWQIRQGVSSFLWGLSVLLVILIYHFDETVTVLGHIPGLRMLSVLEGTTPDQVLFFKGIVTVFSLGMAVYERSKWIFLTICYLLISSMLPLLVSFGIYFISQHSVHGWRHLKGALKTSSYQLWLKALPFSTAGALLILFFMQLNNRDYIGIFFIILSCISIPHVLSMDLFYKNSRSAVHDNN